MKKINLITFLILISFYLVGCKSNNTTKKISFAGASFPSTFYGYLIDKYYLLNGTKVNYQAIGSGFGMKSFFNENIDIAATDDPISENEIKNQSRGIVQIPIIGGNVAIAYNKENCELDLSQKDLVLVAMGKITNWRDLNCEEGPIHWIFRADSSGTTKSLSNSLSRFSNEWDLGTSKSISWPKGIGSKGNAGVASRIKLSPGAIGYINQSFVKPPLKVARIQNLNGEFIRPTSLSGEKTLSTITLNKNLAGNNPNPKVQGAYPISSLTWVLAYKKYKSNKDIVIKDFIRFLLSDEAQAKSTQFGYVPLNKTNLEKAKEKLEEIEESK